MYKTYPRSTLSSNFAHEDMEKPPENLSPASISSDTLEMADTDAERGVRGNVIPELESSSKETPIGRTVTAQDWTGPQDPENPMNWPLWRKIYHTVIPAVFGE